MRMVCGDTGVALSVPNVILYTPRKYFKDSTPSCTSKSNNLVACVAKKTR